MDKPHEVMITINRDFNEVDSDPEEMQARPVALDAMLLKMLVERKNEVVSRNQILQFVWGYDVFPTTRTIDNFVLSFRKYFEEDPSNPRYFQSIRGVGYKFVI